MYMNLKDLFSTPRSRSTNNEGECLYHVFTAIILLPRLAPNTQQVGIVAYTGGWGSRFRICNANPDGVALELSCRHSVSSDDPSDFDWRYQP